MDIDWINKGAPAGGFGDWRGPQKRTRGKAIVDPMQKLKEVWYMERAVQASRSVGRVLFPGNKGFATCFLIAPDIIMTNHHVFGKESDTEGVKIQFNYREVYGEGLVDPDEYTCDAARVFITDQPLDYTVVALSKEVSQEWGYLSLQHQQTIGQGDHIAIIQHPGGAPLQIAVRDNSAAFVDDNTIEYLTNTEYGSSGSPVFNDEWNVVALHSQRVEHPQKKGLWYRNRGTRIEAILLNRQIKRLLPRS